MIISLGNIIYNSYEILNIFTPSIPYFFQVKKFYITRSSLGFSKKTSLFIIVSSILRIFFWFGKRFNITLLFQSILLSIIQLYVLSVAIKFDTNKKRCFYEFEWDSLLKYVFFLLNFIILFLFLTYIFTFDNMYYVETLGILSSIFEVALLLPQIVENYTFKTTKNLSNVVVACWFLGDSIKTYYFMVSNAPLQLFIGGLSQILLDTIIVNQVFYYGRNKIKQI